METVALGAEKAAFLQDIYLFFPFLSCHKTWNALKQIMTCTINANLFILIEIPAGDYSVGSLIIKVQLFLERFLVL